MRVYEHRDGDGRVISFEIRNVGRAVAIRAVEGALGGVSLIRQTSEDFAQFHINGRRFVINEPWGDNSRFLIHEQPPQPSGELDAIQKAVEGHRLTWGAAFGRNALRALVILALVTLAIALTIEWLR